MSTRGNPNCLKGEGNRKESCWKGEGQSKESRSRGGGRSASIHREETIKRARKRVNRRHSSTKGIPGEISKKGEL